MIEPMIATRKLQALKPVTPTPPATSKMKPPTMAPTMPILTGMSRKPQPPQPIKTKWHVYKLAAKRQWVGEIEAVDEREAIEIAAKEFKQPAKKLMAVQRR